MKKYKKRRNYSGSNGRKWHKSGWRLFHSLGSQIPWTLRNDTCQFYKTSRNI